jgi:hypothetical protein
MRRNTTIDAHLDIANAADVGGLRQQLEELRHVRAPIAARLAELATSIPVREHLIHEDELALDATIYDEHVAEHNSRLAAEAEERKKFGDRLQAVCDSLKTLASYQAAIEAGQSELQREEQRLGRSEGWAWWSAPPIFSEARDQLAASYNAGLNQQLRLISTPEPDDPKASPEEIVSALHVPEREGVWSYSTTDANGTHTWEATPVPADGVKTCTYRESYHDVAIAQLSYSPPKDKPRSWAGCAKHAAEFEANYRREHQPA